jgi:LysR family transcriptional regulator, regulator for genes of the gallate degradation pathway
MKLDYPKLRDLVRMLRVIDAGALSSVAASVGRAQQTISYSVHALEHELGAQLFERTSRGTFPTEQALKLGERVRGALAHMAEARAGFLRLRGGRRRGHGSRLFDLNVRNQQMLVFLALCDLQEVRHVAYHLRIDASAVRKALRALEAHMGERLFEKSARGTLIPSEFAALLARQMNLALAEIHTGLEELRSARGRLRGEVVFGALAYGRYTLLPRILSRLGRRHPGLRLRQRIASYEDLTKELALRQLDFIVGVQRKPDLPDLVAHPLLADRVEIVARAGHPLGLRDTRDVSDYFRYPWILPPPVVPLRRAFAECLRRSGIAEPDPSFETADYELIRGLLAESDGIALALRYEALRDVDQGLLQYLPRPDFLSPLLDSPMTLHLVCAAGAHRSAGAQAFFEEATRVAAELQCCLTTDTDAAACGVA